MSEIRTASGASDVLPARDDGRLRDRLRELARRVQELPQVPSVVRPSIPVLYFGDSARFAASPLRVVSVGLNPSREEFPRDEPFRRFPEAQNGSYLASLDAYFRTCPYRRWFDLSFEPLLRGLGASYYGEARSVALHTDLCSPLATDPTWSGLKPEERAALEPPGRRLWLDLVEALRPHLVLVSVARRHLGELAGPSTVIYTVERARPYGVEAWRHALPSGATPLFVFGQAAQTPFGLISAAEKGRIGARILEYLGS